MSRARWMYSARLRRLDLLDGGQALTAMQNIFFDLDGTLTDPAVGIVRCLRFALESVGAAPPADDQLQQYIGPPLHETFRALLNSDNPDLNRRAISCYRQRFGERSLYENAVYPLIPELLAELRDAGFRMWVVTSKPTVFADRIIDHFGLRPFFTRVYGAELSGERSAKADLLAYVLQREQLDPAAACMVGDRKHDVEGASTHAIKSVGVLWGYGSRAELERAGATVLVESPSQAFTAIRRLKWS